MVLSKRVIIFSLSFLVLHSFPLRDCLLPRDSPPPNQPTASSYCRLDMDPPPIGNSLVSHPTMPKPSHRHAGDFPGCGCGTSKGGDKKRYQPTHLTSRNSCCLTACAAAGVGMENDCREGSCFITYLISDWKRAKLVSGVPGVVLPGFFLFIRSVCMVPDRASVF